MIISNKLEKVYAHLLGPHNPLFWFESTYTVIYICKHTQNSCILYLYDKDEFFNIFSAWLSRFEIETRYFFKAL